MYQHLDRELICSSCSPARNLSSSVPILNKHKTHLTTISTKFNIVDNDSFYKANYLLRMTSTNQRKTQDANDIKTPCNRDGRIPDNVHNQT